MRLIDTSKTGIRCALPTFARGYDALAETIRKHKDRFVAGAYIAGFATSACLVYTATKSPHIPFAGLMRGYGFDVSFVFF